MAALPPGVAAEIEQLKSHYIDPRSAMLPALKAVQRQFRWVPPEARREVAQMLGVSPAEVDSVVTFYALLNDRPVGQYVIDVCTNMACYLGGGLEILEHLERKLGLKSGETTPDGLITLRDAECLGACGSAPVLEINLELYENMTPAKVDEVLDKLLSSPV